MAKKKQQEVKFERGQIYQGREIKEAHKSGDVWILFFVDGTRATING